MVFTDRISEIHIKNMESYPFIFFNHLAEIELDYNISIKKEKESVVIYKLTIIKENDNLPKRFKALEEAIKLLFWKEIQVKLVINGEEFKYE